MTSTYLHFTFLMSNQEGPGALLSLLQGIVPSVRLKEKLWSGTSARTRTIENSNYEFPEKPFTRVAWTAKEDEQSHLRLRQAVLDPSPATKLCLPVYMQPEVPREWMTLAHHQRRIIGLGLAEYPHLFRFSIEYVDERFLDSASLFGVVRGMMAKNDSRKLLGFGDVSPLPRSFVGIDTPNRLGEACARKGRLAFDRLHRAMFADIVVCSQIIEEASGNVEFSDIRNQFFRSCADEGTLHSAK